MFRLLLPIRSEVEKVVHWMPEILFAAEIAFRGLEDRIARCRCGSVGRADHAEN
jgi:hypothetical protein